MSDTNTDTNDDAIKKKKNQSTGKTDVGGFIKNFALSMVGIILFIIFGTSWLYIAKLSTAKIIPVNTLYEPYTCEKNTSIGKDDTNREIKVPMNTMSELDFKGLKFWGEPIGKWEQEATFASQGFIKSFNHSFISNLRKKTDNPASASNYDIFKSILVNNVIGTGFWLYDKVSIPDGIRMMPDSLKIVIYGLFGVMFFPFFWIWNGAASFYYTIMTLSRGQQTSPENPNDGGYDGGLFDGVDALKNGDSIFSNIGKACLRFFVWIPIWLIVIPVLSMFVFPVIGTFYPFFKMLFSAGYKLKEYDAFKPDKQSDSKSFLDFIKDNLVYKRTLILVFAILNLFTCTNTYLGENYFTAVVLATIIAVVFGNIFVNSEPDDATMISVKDTVVEELEKPASLDDECEEFQTQVIDAWTKLKEANESVDELINYYPDNNKIMITELKKRKKHIIEQFKKLDGKQPLDNVMVTNYDIASDNTISYTRLYSEYTKFIENYKADAIAAKEAKEQAAKEEEEKAQAAAAAQAETDRVAAEARNAKIAANSLVAGNVVSAPPVTTPSATPSATTSNNNNNNNNNNSDTGVDTGVDTVVDTGVDNRPERLIEKTGHFTQPNPLRTPKSGVKKNLDTGGGSSATGGGSSSAQMTYTNNNNNNNNSVNTTNASNSTPVEVKKSNLASNIEESPVPVKIEENRPSATDVNKDSSKEGRPAYTPPGDKGIGIGKEVVNDYIGARASNVTSSSSSSGGGGGSSSRSSPASVGKNFETGVKLSVVNLLEGVGRDKENVVKIELPKLDKQDITEILEVYKKKIAEVTTTQEEIVNIKKYLPMIIEKQLKLNREQPLLEDEMKAYIRQKFPTAAETGIELSNAISKLDDEELARPEAAKAGGGNPNLNSPAPVVQKEVSDPAKKPSFSWGNPFSSSKVSPTLTPQQQAYNHVKTSIAIKKKLDNKTNLELLNQEQLSDLINEATGIFVKGKDPIALKRNVPLYDIINQLLTEKYKANVGGTQVVDELKRISAQQAEGSYTLNNLTGGSKNKQKTLKNRRQRFNIRLV